jgi:hypothetical protein
MLISPLGPVQDRATRAYVGLLGPCFKTGQMDDRPTYSGLSLHAKASHCEHNTGDGFSYKSRNSPHVHAL